MGPAVLPIGPQDSTVAFLPSAHIAQRVVIELLPIRCGMPVTFAESLLKLPQEIRRVRPTLLLAPPRMWERIYSTICTELRKRPAAIRKAFYGALGLGLAAARYRREGKPVPARIRFPLAMADRIFFRKVRGRFGGRLRLACSGAAPLSKDLAEFYEAIGMPLIEGYGLTEGGVAALNPLDRPKPGSIGKPIEGVAMRFSEDNEILIKSPCLFSGYLNDPATTAEVLRDGWLHTGDLGHSDSDGYVFITGRKKELIVSSTGKKIHPARVESLFKMEPLVSQVLLIGDRLPYLAALFTINPAAAETLKGMEEWKGRPASELAQAPPVLAEIQKAVTRVNRQLAPFEQVRKHRVLSRDFSIENGELTATMKVRRTRAMENFREHIEELYAGRE
jgi:long-chain acyl-CoA synthetase